MKTLYLIALSFCLTACGGGGTTGSGNTAPVIVNQAPIASFTQSCTQLNCSFDASASSDSDGSVTDYSWDFGDGGSSSGVNSSHSYSTSGDYTVTLTVTDNAGATGSTNIVVKLSTNSPASKGVLVTGTAGQPVRRHIKWHGFRPGLRETLLTSLVDIKRQLCGIASVDVQWSFS